MYWVTQYHLQVYLHTQNSVYELADTKHPVHREWWMILQATLHNGGRPSFQTQGRAMLWWQGPTYHGIVTPTNLKLCFMQILLSSEATN